jgi:signal transduction histidine kinase
MMVVQGTGPDALVIAAVTLAYEHDVVLARQYARLIAGELGFDSQDQVRFATAVSELARNAYQYARHGRVTFALDREHDRGVLTAQVRDDGPGIADLERILLGGYVSSTGMGIGISGARRLSDRFAIESALGTGTTVTVGKIVGHAGPAATAEAASRVADALQRRDASNPVEELQRQNQELATALEALATSKAEVDRLNLELEETNRGVLALYAELDDRATELRRLSESKSRFLSDVSHELRTPLSSIVNLARILLARIDGQLTPEQERQIALVQRSAENLTEMVSDLLDIAKIEAGKVDLRPDGFSVEELFASLRGMFRPLATSEQVALVFEDAAPPITLHTDEQRIAQVLRNFISNALKFTTSGEVRIAARLEDAVVRFTVTDTGIGISPADQQRIFEEFAQVDGPIQRRVRGTGLGLPLARKLAAMLGGGVEVESELGVGSRFSLIVPRDIRSMEATSA